VADLGGYCTKRAFTLHALLLLYPNKTSKIFIANYTLYRPRRWRSMPITDSSPKIGYSDGGGARAKNRPKGKRRMKRRKEAGMRSSPQARISWLW
jgi:hypothetical protein